MPKSSAAESLTAPATCARARGGRAAARPSGRATRPPGAHERAPSATCTVGSRGHPDVAAERDVGACARDRADERDHHRLAGVVAERGPDRQAGASRGRPRRAAARARRAARPRRPARAAARAAARCCRRAPAVPVDHAERERAVRRPRRSGRPRARARSPVAHEAGHVELELRVGALQSRAIGDLPAVHPEVGAREHAAHPQERVLARGGVQLERVAIPPGHGELRARHRREPLRSRRCPGSDRSRAAPPSASRAARSRASRPST